MGNTVRGEYVLQRGRRTSFELHKEDYRGIGRGAPLTKEIYNTREAQHV